MLHHGPVLIRHRGMTALNILTARRRHPMPPVWTTPLRIQQQLQVRPYIYFPVSWDEVKERWQRWMERAEERLVEVKVVSRRHRNKMNQRRRQHFTKFVSRSHTRWNVLLHNQRKSAQRMNNFALPLPGLKQPRGLDESEVLSPTMRSRYQGWKSRRNEQYQGWKRIGQEHYQGWKHRRQEQYQRWKMRRRQDYQRWMQRQEQDFVRTRRVLLNEYSKAEWFDELGRPLTSRDSIGRFVNPWQSQSTNGLHSIRTIANWQIQRFRRELSQFGDIGNLSMRLPLPTVGRTNTTERKKSFALPDLNSKRLTTTWLGHSTCFIQVNGFTVLTDPIFSDRSGPYQSLPIGYSRVEPASHSIEELIDHCGGSIDVCCITHDHYDHMDKNSVLSLSPHVEKWVVPLGIADWLVERCGIPLESVIELEWWQQAHLQKSFSSKKVVQIESEKSLRATHANQLSITCCPASHWASRTMFDRNKRLWCSFALTSPTQRMFFCGDTGYPDDFPLFRQIGDALGPFDLACIPIGAYAPAELNKDSHVNPAEAVQIHKDISSRHSVAIHWGTFPLSEEPLDEPPRLLNKALTTLSETVAPFNALRHGATIEVDTFSSTAHVVSDSIGMEHPRKVSHEMYCS